MEEVERVNKLPDIEPNVSWKKWSEHLTWRRASPEIREVNLKSLGGKQRQTSSNSERQPSNKKHKLLAAESSSSSSGNGSDESPAKEKQKDDVMNTSN